MKINERMMALRILKALTQEKISLSQQHANLSLSPLCKNVCFGVSRHWFRLQAIANYLLKKPPKDPDLMLALCIGLYQLHYLNIPDYAVVKETVALMDALKKSWAKGLINAILRRYCREKTSILASIETQPDYLYGHPEWLQKRIQTDWPNAWHTILQENDIHPPMTLRVNRTRTSAKDYMKRLQAINLEAHDHPFANAAVILSKPVDVHVLPGFQEGEVSVQDAAAQLAVSFLDLKPGLRVLDACCAPGGKTCHILETEPNLAVCVALDVDSRRLERVQENLTRLRCQARVCQGDALHPDTWWDGIPFDRILLDAPCSATGVIRRHPDIKLTRTHDDITAIAMVQAALLKTLWPLLANNGIMVYATCSVLPEENEAQIATFLIHHPDAQFAMLKPSYGNATPHGLQLLPGEHEMDGFFYSVLKKNVDNF